MVIIGFILGAFLFWYFSKKKKESVLSDAKVSTASAVEQTIPDLPLSFGYKSMWFAVKTDDKQKVAELMQLKNIEVCNWQVGIQKAYRGNVFVTPAIDGWTLVCSSELPAGDSEASVKEVKNLLETLSRTFEEAQFFCTHRVVEFHSWMKARAGVVKRIYSYLGESGQNIAIEGEVTDFEKSVNLVNTFSEEAKDENYFDREDIVWPNESFVMQVAANWSVDPSNLEVRTDLEPGLGILGVR
ncbi:MAG TPA: hypothetical protein VGF79_11225 [Bacteroidia bacterium]